MYMYVHVHVHRSKTLCSRYLTRKVHCSQWKYSDSTCTMYMYVYVTSVYREKQTSL